MPPQEELDLESLSQAEPFSELVPKSSYAPGYEGPKTLEQYARLVTILERSIDQITIENEIYKAKAASYRSAWESLSKKNFELENENKRLNKIDHVSMNIQEGDEWIKKISKSIKRNKSALKKMIAQHEMLSETIDEVKNILTEGEGPKC